MIQFIQSIPGPSFLLYFALYFLALFILLKFVLRKMDSTALRPYPKTSDLNGFQASLLRGRNKPSDILKLIVFDLWNRKFIEFSDQKTITRTDKINTHKDELSGIEKNIITSLPGTFAQIERTYKNSTELKMMIDLAEKNLVQQKLLKNQEERSASNKIYWLFFFLALAPAFIKLYLGITHGKPVVLLVLFLIVGLIITIISYPKKMTLLGKRFLAKAISDERARLRQVRDEDDDYPSSMDPVLTAALLGIAALTIFSEFGAASYAIPDSSDSSSSIDSGSSDSSSSDGGSSDGGSGCSSCGGCGGGD